MQNPRANYVGALLNSLFQHNYRGTIWIGYQNSQLPDWTVQTTKISATDFDVAPGLQLRFIPLAKDAVLSEFIHSVISESGADAVVYFAEDVVVEVDWAFFAEWTELGVALCADQQWSAQDTESLRLAARSIYEHVPVQQTPSVNVYVNDGFLGLRATRMAFLDSWRQIHVELAKHAQQLRNLVPEPSENFISQLALNAALDLTKESVSLLGPNGMAFAHGHRVMSRTAPSTVSCKIRNNRFRSINGARMHLKYSSQPLQIASAPETIIRELDRAYGNFTGRDKKQGRS
jgi:hypothetical protein